MELNKIIDKKSVAIKFCIIYGTSLRLNKAWPLKAGIRDKITIN